MELFENKEINELLMYSLYLLLIYPSIYRMLLYYIYHSHWQSVKQLNAIRRSPGEWELASCFHFERGSKLWAIFLALEITHEKNKNRIQFQTEHMLYASIYSIRSPHFLPISSSNLQLPTPPKQKYSPNQSHDRFQDVKMCAIESRQS